MKNYDFIMKKSEYEKAEELTDRFLFISASILIFLGYALECILFGIE